MIKRNRFALAATKRLAMLERCTGWPSTIRYSLPGGLFEQPLDELHKALGFELFLKHHKGRCAAIGDRRDHAAAEALARGTHHWGFSQRGIAASGNMIAPQAHLIAPVDRGVLGLGLARDGRIDLLE